jgi:hypothetical protein
MTEQKKGAVRPITNSPFYRKARTAPARVRYRPNYEGVPDPQHYQHQIQVGRIHVAILDYVAANPKSKKSTAARNAPCSIPCAYRHIRLLVSDGILLEEHGYLAIAPLEDSCG